MPEASLATPSMVIGWLMMLPAAGLLMSSAGAWVSTKTPPLSEAVVTMPLALRNCTDSALLPSPADTV